MLVAAAAFVLLTGVAMARYPGGTFLDRTTVGHRFFENFFCDLFHAHGLDGRPNPGAALAQAGMLAILVGLFAHFMVVARVVRSRGLAWSVRVLGTVCALAAIAVPLTPSDRFPRVHSMFVLLAAVPGILAASASSVGLLLGRATLAGGLGVALCLVASADAALLLDQMRTHGPTPFALPALQKIAAIVLLGWMAATGSADRARLSRVDEEP